MSVYGYDEAMLREILRVENAVDPQDPFAPTKLDPLVTMGTNGKEVPQKAVMIMTSTGDWKWVATHSPNYILVPNERVMQILRDTLTRAEINDARLASMAWNGKKFAALYEVPGINLDENGDRITLGVEGVNSYDGSLSLGIRFVARRIVCSNGLYFSNLLGSFILKHKTENEADIEDAVIRLQQGARQFMDLAPYIEAMKRVPVTLRTLMEWHEYLTTAKPGWPDSKTGDVLAALRACGNKPTMWDLLNAFTTVTSHHLEAFSGMRQSERVCNYAIEQVARVGG